MEKAPAGGLSPGARTEPGVPGPATGRPVMSHVNCPVGYTYKQVNPPHWSCSKTFPVGEICYVASRILDRVGDKYKIGYECDVREPPPPCIAGFSPVLASNSSVCAREEPRPRCPLGFRVGTIAFTPLPFKPLPFNTMSRFEFTYSCNPGAEGTL